MNLTRRNFLVGCSAAIAAMAGGRISGLAFANPADTTERDILVTVFLRGGCDALSLIAPTSDPDYIASRPGDIRVRADGTTPGWELKNALPGIDFRLHPAAQPLHELYGSDKLAIVHACGLTNGTRSHFDAMDYMELGTPGNKLTATGWLTRHLLSNEASMLTAPALPAVAGSSSVPTSLLGSIDAVAVKSPSSFGLSGNQKYRDKQQEALRDLYDGETALHQAGTTTLETMDMLSDTDAPEPEVEYPNISLGNSLKAIAQLIKMDVGLQVATVDYGGWDHHENQVFHFPRRIDDFARALAAFYNDLSAYHNRLTVVVMSEFGRRLKANASNGTDHGYGGMMLALGGNILGGRMYGDWPGLAKEQLNRNVDLEVTTDYRVVLGEILAHRLGNNKLGAIFPGLTEDIYTNQSRGIVNATNTEPLDFTTTLPSQPAGDNRVYLPLTVR